MFVVDDMFEDVVIGLLGCGIGVMLRIGMSTLFALGD